MDPRYGDIYNSLGSVYDPQTQVIKQQQAALPAQFDAQRTALDQAKTNAFQGITDTANNRGVLFSGFSPDAQAKYTGATYLPAVAKVAAAQTQATTQLQQALNDINVKRSAQAQGTLQSILDREQKDREFQAAQAAQQAQASVRSAGGGGRAPSAAQIKQQDLATVTQALQSKIGRDNHVSQETWNAAINAWTGAGYNAKDFVNSNIRFVNQRYKGYSGFN